MVELSQIRSLRGWWKEEGKLPSREPRSVTSYWSRKRVPCLGIVSTPVPHGQSGPMYIKWTSAQMQVSCIFPVLLSVWCSLLDATSHQYIVCLFCWLVETFISWLFTLQELLMVKLVVQKHHFQLDGSWNVTFTCFSLISFAEFIYCPSNNHLSRQFVAQNICYDYNPLV